MKKRTLRLFALAMLCTAPLCSCSDKYGDQLRDLGTRVEYLEEHIPQMNRDIAALQVIVMEIQQNGYITDVRQNSDGTTTITYNDGTTVTLRDGRNGNDGQDGQEATLRVGVWQDVDGQWYWTLNGQWLLDQNGDKVRAGATDGADGLNGRNGRDAVAPQMRINDDGFWEISSDGGNTWINTGVSANGKDGKDGRADIFSSVVISDDGNYLIVTLADGTPPFTIPIK